MTSPKCIRRSYALIFLGNPAQFSKRAPDNHHHFRPALIAFMTIAALFCAGRAATAAIPNAGVSSAFLLASSLYVDPAGTCSGNSPCFTTIQAAINAASPGDIINVFAGTYAEQIDINKALTLLGPNANINPNTGARVAEAIVIPTVSDPINPSFAGPIVVYLSVSGSTFKGFTVDGNNPALTSGVVYNGADVDAQFGIYGDGSANLDAVIENNIVRNIGDISVWLNTFGFGGARNANSRINANKVDNSLGPFGQGIRISDDAWADITNNVVTRVRVGITIENFSGNVTTHPASVISDNNVTSFRIGIRHNLHYVYSAPGFTIARNMVQSYVQSPVPPQVTAATAYQGIRVESIQQTVAVTVEDNTVNGNRTTMQAGGYTRDEGLNVTNASATSPNILFRRNNVQNFIRGAYHETPAIPDFECNVFASNTNGILVDAAANSLIAHNNNITGNTLGLQNNASASVNAQGNWWGAANGPGPVGPGSGDGVSTNVDFSNWLTAPSSCVNLVTAGQLLISEFRLHGPGGPADEFIEIYNNTDLPHIVSSASGTGYAIAASDGVARCVIANGTTIPARGYFLCANSTSYSLSGYSSGAPVTIGGIIPEPEGPVNLKPLKGAKGERPLTPTTKDRAPAPVPIALVLPFTTATANATYTTDVPENAGIAIFRTSVPTDFTLANRLDAVGSTSETNSLYR